VKARGIDVHPQIMIPLVGVVPELKMQAEIINSTAQQIFAERGETIAYKIGTMIEVPRAALVADKIATIAEFFSFGTNDLTQMTFGYSRDDAPKFLKIYKNIGILKTDPFAILDQEGVGQLIKMAVEKGRSTKPELKVGICGEHGGEPSSVKFCAGLGMDYVSCSPYRVPIARVAAAQAAVEAEK
jgi:pyruvate,orthophosphate dikinase